MHSIAVAEQSVVDQIERAVSILRVFPDQVTEVRVLGVAAASGFFKDPHKLAIAVAELEATGQQAGIYLTLNHIDPDLYRLSPEQITSRHKMTADPNVLRRLWLPIDIDPKRIDPVTKLELTGISATDVEFSEAHRVTEAVYQLLIDRGVPVNSIVRVSSGNGEHIHIRVDEPNDIATTTLFSRILKSLDACCSVPTAHVDIKTANAARIMRLPGTTARKGIPTSERPHRVSGILSSPATTEICTRTILESIAILGEEQSKPKGRPSTSRSTGTSSEPAGAWLARHGINVHHTKQLPNGILYALDPCPMDLTHLQDKAAFVIEFTSGAKSAGCLHERCKDWHWGELRRKYEPGAQVLQLRPRPTAAPAGVDPVTGEDLGAGYVTTPDTREDLLLDPHTRNTALERSVELLHGDIFLRDTIPVIVQTLGEKTELHGVHHPVGGVVVARASSDHLQFLLDKQFRCMKLQPSGKQVAKEFPNDYASQIIGAASIIGHFRQLSGVARSPLFNIKDGSVTTTPGYHAESGLYVDWSGTLPEIPETPTLTEAAEALEVLLRPFREYIKQGADPVAIAAAALTASIRATLPTAPAIVMDGSVPACGKGKLARALSAIATGGSPATITEGPNPEELEKRLAAAILSGAPVIMLDNLQRKLASSTLESGLTEATAAIRVLGHLDTVNVHWCSLVLITANNAVLRRDLLRRSIPVRIVAQTEDPERSEYDFDPVVDSTRDRGTLLAAAYTVLRFALQQAPKTPILGSFEVWSRLVGGACTLLLGKSPVDLISEAKAHDLDADDERSVVAALAEHYPYGFRAEQAASDTRIPWGGIGSIHTDDRGFATKKSIGYWLRSHKDRIWGELQLTRKPIADHGSLWCLEKSTRMHFAAGT